jgi:hypothetical protein
MSCSPKDNRKEEEKMQKFETIKTLAATKEWKRVK